MIKRLWSIIISLTIVLNITPLVKGVVIPSIDIVQNGTSNVYEVVIKNITDGIQSLQLDLVLKGSSDGINVAWYDTNPSTFSKIEYKTVDDNTNITFYVDATTSLVKNGNTTVATLSDKEVSILSVPKLKTVDKKFTERVYADLTVSATVKEPDSGSGDSSNNGNTDTTTDKTVINSSVVTSIDKIKENNSITLDNNVVIKFDDKAIEALAGAGSVSVSVKEKTSNIPNISKLYDINISKDSQEVTNFDGNLTIEIPYTGNENTTVAYYIPEAGTPELIAESMLKNNKLLFKTNHLSTFGAGENTKEFTDVTSAWYTDDVNFLSARGIIDGFKDNTFKPNNDITRAEFIALIAKYEKVKAVNTHTDFKDVSSQKWYSAYVKWAKDNNIVSGDGSGLFNPERKISREEVAVIMANYIKFKTGKDIPSVQNTKFIDDKNISTWAKSSVNYLSEISLINGKNNNNFAAKDNTTRAETSAILKRYIVSLFK